MIRDQLGSPTTVGFSGRGNWLIGGAVGGIVGSLLFGGVLWLVEPTIVTETIPAIYGVDPGTAGWAFHVTHGLVLGALFGFLITREPILATLTADVATDFIARMGLGMRFALAGIVYGLAVWTFLPVFAQTVWVTVGGMADPGFPVAAFESLVGHLLYGMLLGALFSVFVDLTPEAAETDAPFDEPSDGT